MKTSVFDASALLAMFFAEPGMEKMRELFQKSAETDHPALISALNWAEVLYLMERRRGVDGMDTARRFRRTMPIEVVALDSGLAESAALLKNRHELGLAAAFAAALAKSRNAELVTADNEFKRLEKEIRINWLK